MRGARVDARVRRAVESLIGSEPQRLSFGAPPEVLHSFVEKMKLCWFNGSGAALSGYRFPTGERAAGEGDSADGYPHVTIYGQDSSAEAFEVQFHKYNENTLIVTRNVSLPQVKLSNNLQLFKTDFNNSFNNTKAVLQTIFSLTERYRWEQESQNLFA